MRCRHEAGKRSAESAHRSAFLQAAAYALIRIDVADDGQQKARLAAGFF
jgi:hypothetical protein